MELKLSDLYQSYTNQNNKKAQDISNIKTALFRYTLPGLGYIIPSRSQKRLHPGDLQLAIAFCEDIYVNATTGQKLIQFQEVQFVESKLNDMQMRHNRRVLKAFLEFVNEAVKQNSSPIQKKKKYRSSKVKVADFSQVEEAKVRRSRKKTIALSFDFNNYDQDSTVVKRELKRIKSEIEDFRIFLSTIQDSTYSINESIMKTKILLGWQYIKTQSLSKVSIYKLVTKYNIYPKRKNNSEVSSADNYITYMVSKAEALDIGKEYAKQTISFIENFFEEYKVKSKSTKQCYISSLINIAKYLYKDITDKEENSNYEDISVIKRLRVLGTLIPNDKKRIEASLPSWEIIIKALYELKQRADQDCGLAGNSIIKTHRSVRLQRFLILGFFTLVPPPRQRIVRELRLGETLEHGDYLNGVFTSCEQLPDKSKAKYYIHLQSEDYKTGKKYGEWLGEFPNFEFPDGTKFYDYLNSWISEYRQIMLGNDFDHGYLFMNPRIHVPINAERMNQFIRYCFHSTINLKLSPHKLRTIFDTYLADIGADKKTRESAAFWMRHSPEIARSTYTKQTLENKLRPGIDSIQSINKKMLAE